MKKRFKQQTLRLTKNEETLIRYDKAITEYFSSNVAETVPGETERLTTLCYNMPNEAVIRED